MTTIRPTRTVLSHRLAVVGEFNANFTDGTTAGAFGADKE